MIETAIEYAETADIFLIIGLRLMYILLPVC